MQTYTAGRRLNFDMSKRMHWRTFLRPCLAVKGWMFFLGLGVALCGFGLALFLRHFHFPPSISALIHVLTLPFLPAWLRGTALVGLGILLVVFGIWLLKQQMETAVLHQGDLARNMLELTVRQQQRLRYAGPKVVVIGGGTGMPGLLRALRPYTDNITAIATVADDGGSSGTLRRSMGILPPGDFRNNIAAMSDAEELMTQLLQYRFGDNAALGNHNFGNIFITAMTAITGSFETGLAESSRILAVRGRILPSTLDNVTLCAEIKRAASGQTNHTETPQPSDLPIQLQDDAADQTDRFGAPQPTDTQWIFVRGESRIPQSGGEIMRVFLEPDTCRAYPETILALLEADLILAAPGSFFTSLMPNLLVPRIREAIKASPAVRFYVCNLMTQPGETDGFDVAAHMHHLRMHAENAFTTVLANDNFSAAKIPAGQQWLQLPEAGTDLPFRLFSADLINDENPSLHDPQKVGPQVMEIYERLRQEREIPAY